MTKQILFSLFLFATLNAFGQDYLDKKVVIIADDTTGLYQRVRIAFGKNNFQLREDGNMDTVTTFPRELRKIPGYMIARAEINNDTVTLSGIYGLTFIDDWGYTRTPKDYKDVMYMKRSKTWPLLMKVAGEIGTNVTYAR